MVGLAKPRPTLHTCCRFPTIRLTPPTGTSSMTRLLTLPFILAGCSFALAQAPMEMKAHTALVHNVAFSPDGKYFATAGFDKTAKIYEFTNGMFKEFKVL